MEDDKASLHGSIAKCLRRLCWASIAGLLILLPQLSASLFGNAARDRHLVEEPSLSHYHSNDENLLFPLDFDEPPNTSHHLLKPIGDRHGSSKVPTKGKGSSCIARPNRLNPDGFLSGQPTEGSRSRDASPYRRGTCINPEKDPFSCPDPWSGGIGGKTGYQHNYGASSGVGLVARSRPVPIGCRTKWERK